MHKRSPTPKETLEKNMIARGRDWEAAEEHGRSLEKGDFFGAAGMMENNWGQDEKEVSPVVPQRPLCCRRFRRNTTLLFGGGRRRI
jgi:hypothetical protein